VHISSLALGPDPAELAVVAVAAGIEAAAGPCCSSEDGHSRAGPPEPVASWAIALQDSSVVAWVMVLFHSFAAAAQVTALLSISAVLAALYGIPVALVAGAQRIRLSMLGLVRSEELVLLCLCTCSEPYESLAELQWFGYLGHHIAIERRVGLAGPVD
jgi:hypothetical protein